MYRLTLSRDERRAFDWVGNRYSSSGDDVSLILYTFIVTHVIKHGVRHAG